MQRLYLTLGFLAAVCFQLSAQQFARLYLFESYTPAQVKLRNRSVTTAQVNYDAANKTMLFLQGDDIMEFANVAQIDTIKIAGRKFVPADKGFHEVVQLSHGLLYIDWLLKDVNIGSKGAMGAVTQGSVHNLQMTDFELSGSTMYTPYQQQKLGVTDVYRRKNDNTYYIKVEGKTVKLKTVKQVLKQFAPYASPIEDYIKEHSLNFRETPDAIALIDYCQTLAAGE